MTDYDWLTKRFLLSVEHLRLWGDNPRLSPDIEYVTTANFADGICSDINERDAFIGLIESIGLSGFIPADPIVVWQKTENKKYYVAEGNRRVLALKLLLDPIKAPISIQARVRKISAQSKYLNNFKKIKVAIAPTFEDAEWYIFQRHSSAALHRKWSREQQFLYIKRVFEEETGDVNKTQQRIQLPISEINGIIRILKLKEYCLRLKECFSEKEFIFLNSHKFPISTFERFLVDNSIMNKLHIRYENENVFVEANPRDFNLALVTILKGLAADDDSKITSRTSSQEVKQRLVDFDIAPQWELKENNSCETINKTKNNKSNDEVLSSAKKQERNFSRTSLIPQELTLNTTNIRLNDLWNEMKKISVKRYCNISSAALRIFLDLSVKEFLGRKNLIEDIQKKKQVNIREINLSNRLEYLKSYNEFPKDLRGIISKLLNAENEFSLDVLNGYMHSSKTCFIDDNFLKRFFDFLFPLFQYMLDISSTGANNE